MKLLSEPKAPRDDGSIPIPFHYLRQHTEWSKYLPQLQRHGPPDMPGSFAS